MTLVYIVKVYCARHSAFNFPLNNALCSLGAACYRKHPRLEAGVRLHVPSVVLLVCFKADASSRKRLALQPRDIRARLQLVRAQTTRKLVVLFGQQAFPAADRSLFRPLGEGHGQESLTRPFGLRTCRCHSPFAHEPPHYSENSSDIGTSRNVSRHRNPYVPPVINPSFEL